MARPAERNKDAGFGVYIHWPFCASKCPYCDFNSHVRAGGIDEARFTEDRTLNAEEIGVAVAAAAGAAERPDVDDQLVRVGLPPGPHDGVA